MTTEKDEKKVRIYKKGTTSWNHGWNRPQNTCSSKKMAKFQEGIKGLK